MLATATHDHKRGEDVRARLAVLSEIPGDWAATLREWRETNAVLLGTADGRPAPDAIDQAMLYQTLVGAWPLDLSPDDTGGLAAFAGRIKRWQLKAIREAKRHSRWVTPNEAYEKTCADFVDALLRGDLAADFRRDLAGFVERIAAAGAVNGLSQALIRNTAPGVPDLYQGTDFWDFSLVDPDNRAPVDYGARMAALNGTDDTEALLGRWRDGHIKQYVVTRALALRRDRPALFMDGSYEPLVVEGVLADRVIAFARRKGDDIAIAIATRLASKLIGNDQPLVAADFWKDTAIVLPHGIGQLTDRLTGRTITVTDGRIELAAALDMLPVALFTTE
jgi:(1->4)-alpha-D-glucan 1-alpha-D-glucosylmutase